MPKLYLYRECRHRQRHPLAFHLPAFFHLVIATVVEGKADLADVLFLIAFILFVIVAIFHLMRRAFEGALLAFGLAAVALAWLVL